MLHLGVLTKASRESTVLLFIEDRILWGMLISYYISYMAKNCYSEPYKSWLDQGFEGRDGSLEFSSSLFVSRTTNIRS